MKIDILDRLQVQKGYVRLILANGEIVFGKPDCIVYDDDENGEDVIKQIRFEQWDEYYAKYYGVDDIREFDPIDEDDIPPAE